MTPATTILRKEHEAILKMLEATEEVAQRLQRGESVPGEILDGLLEFFQLFADRCHHGKEEELLFPLLEQKGVPVAGGPIGVMLSEHRLGRSLIRTMVEAAQAYGNGAAGASQRWAEAAYGYAALLRHHIDKENHVLFQAAEAMLSEAEQAELARKFEQVEEEKMGAGTHARLHRLMEKLLHDIQVRNWDPAKSDQHEDTTARQR